MSSGFQSIFLTNKIINYIKFTSFHELDSNLFLKVDVFLIFNFSFTHKYTKRQLCKLFLTKTLCKG